MALVELLINGEKKKIDIETPILSEKVISANGANISFPCGGNGKCKKCVINAFGELSEPTEAEKNAFSKEQLENGYRLACQTKILGDCKIVVNNEKNEKIIKTGIFPKFQKKPKFKNYGIAVDIGTTTIAAAICDRESVLATAVSLNPQQSFGADVITRIGKWLEGNGETLASLIRCEIEKLADELCNKISIDKKLIDEIVIVGNTTMLYLFSNRNPDCLSHLPFIADELFGKTYSAKDFFKEFNDNSVVFLPYCMSAFVGADITCSVLSCDMMNDKDITLMADIGTNGEMALRKDGRLLTCSTAAGPAFEGAGLYNGVGAASGAIDHVSVSNGKLLIHTIDNEEPIGICGSGIIDIISCFVKLEIIDENGHFDTDNESFAANFCKINDCDAFKLSDNVAVTQNDIRMVQLAKSAIKAGIITLIHSADLKISDIKKFHVAGGFGSYINYDSASKIGLFPKELKNKVEICGNASLSGAIMLLLNDEIKTDSKNIKQTSEFIDLSANTFFFDNYIDGMSF